MTVLLRAENAGKTYGPLTALRDVSLSIDQETPSIIAVVGESGSGKTTLARMLLGLVAPTTGRVLYHGDDLRRLGSQARMAFRRDVQAIFQDPYEVYNPFYRVDHVLTTPVRKFRLARTAEEARSLIEAALRAVGLRPEEILGRFPHQLSGGQRQRIMVARAVLLRPKLIVADEPVSMVDASLRATILETLRTLHEELGISIVYITHDLATAYQISDTILVMYRAAVVEAGAIAPIIECPAHPYTKLLIASIPLVSIERTWMGEATAAPAGVVARGGCSFADRCPAAMPECAEAVPPLYRTDHDRVVACYRHRSSPELAAADLGEVLKSNHKSAACATVLHRGGARRDGDTTPPAQPVI
jgi:oligopeptide/dipeptide ABC transporter ATP-binding protein